MKKTFALPFRYLPHWLFPATKPVLRSCGVNLIIFIVLFFLILQPIYAQKDKKQSEKRNTQTDQIIKNNPEEYAIQEQIFKMGLKYGDVDLAKSALAKMIVLNPGNTSLKDSLAMLYFKAGQYVQCILVSREIIENNPNDTIILELMALSEVNTGYIKAAINDYEKLYALSKNVLHLYQIAFLQYQLKRYTECKYTIERLLADPQTGLQQLNVASSEKSRQTVPLKAVVLNMKGVLSMDVNENDTAKDLFSEALKIFPDFELAKDNLKLLESKVQKN